MKQIYVLIIFIISINTKAQLVGHWSFDDSDSVTKAIVGNPLILTGTHEFINGPNGTGAVRIGVSVKNGDHYNYYIDGFKSLIGKQGAIDERFSFNVNGVLLFADNDGEDHKLDIADIKLFSKALTNHEMKDLGGFNDKPPVVIAPPDTVILPYLQSPTSVGSNTWHIRFATIADTRTFPNKFTNVVTSIREKVTDLYGDLNIENNLNLILSNGNIVHYGPNLSEYKSQWFEPLSGITADVPIMVSIGDYEHDAELDRWREYSNQTDYPEIQKTYDYWSYTIVDIDQFFRDKKQLRLKKVS